MGGIHTHMLFIWRSSSIHVPGNTPSLNYHNTKSFMQRIKMFRIFEHYSKVCLLNIIFLPRKHLRQQMEKCDFYSPPLFHREFNMPSGVRNESATMVDQHIMVNVSADWSQAILTLPFQAHMPVI